MKKFCNVLYFKHVIENALNSFFADSKNRFTLDKTQGLLVFSSGMTKAGLKKDLKNRIILEIGKLIRPYDPMEREFFFMVGSCAPSENYLLKYIDRSRYFPERVQKYIDSGTIKYFLKVDGIRIDLTMFNSVFEEIFDEFFRRRGFKRIFPNNFKNLFFVKDRHLDCYMVWRIIKNHFGRINVCNMREDNKDMLKSNLYSVNNRIDDYVNGKKEILKSEDLRITVEEIEQYLEDCVNDGV